ncbi:MAG: hypothetical protein HYZ50_18610 [Deltaproteobacteria bacterium]|nr:hypothetical protein [Deltaproteobacteria bacterium]
MRRISSALISVFLLVSNPSVTSSHAGESAEVKALKKQVQQLQRTVEQLQRTMQTIQTDVTTRDEKLEQHVEAVRKEQNEALPARLESPLDQALKESEIEERQPVSTDLLSRRFGGANLRLLDLSLNGLFAGGSSTEREATLQTLQGGGHDPRKRGFTVQNVELSLMGAVDPYFTGEAHLVYFIDSLEGESVFELEEAFLTTTSLPYGLQLEAGQFFTEFGQINPRHPHQWEWQDQPIINTRLFGPDGMRGPGFRLGWLLPTPRVFETPWFSELHFGMQNANGETMASFLASEEFYEERSLAGRPFVEREVRKLKDLAYLTRWNNSWNVTDALTGVVGFSGLYGPNATGPNGDTWIYGADMKWRWRPANNFRGWPFFLWQTELMQRDFRADRFVDASNPEETVTLPGRTLHDWGLYSQLLYGFQYGWAAGLRYEYAGGSGESIDGRKNDPFRSDRHRVSPLLAWHPTEFSRIRLQYNFDYAKHLTGGKDAHSVWLGFEIMYGAHAAHTY